MSEREKSRERKNGFVREKESFTSPSCLEFGLSDDTFLTSHSDECRCMCGNADFHARKIHGNSERREKSERKNISRPMEFSPTRNAFPDRPV